MKTEKELQEEIERLIKKAEKTKSENAIYKLQYKKGELFGFEEGVQERNAEVKQAINKVLERKLKDPNNWSNLKLQKELLQKLGLGEGE